MTVSALSRPRLLRAALVSASMLVAGSLAVGPAAARVGVTSATDGDPLGKPPAEAERVLRIGIDVQANELITTSTNDRAHLVFLDGSSLTVSPNAQLTIDRFVFDPNSKTGELAINASRGVLRLVGGKISKTRPITITTPSSTIGIRGGITLLDVQASRTASTFVFGKSMSVTGAGATENVTRPGSQVVTALGARPGPPTLLPPGALSGQLAQLEGRGAPAGKPGGGGASAPAGAIDRSIQSSGLSAANSGQTARVVSLHTGEAFGSGPGPSNQNPNNSVSTAIASAGDSAATQQAVQQASEERRYETLDPGVIPPTSPGSTLDFTLLNIDPSSRLSTINELATLNMQQATATYSGAALALINGSSVVSGTYQNAWNFGAQNGIATVRIDNTVYGGGTAPNTFLINNGPAFQSTNPLPSTSGPQGRSINNLIGVFLSTPTTPANQQLGTFTVTGPNNYNGVGVYTGTR
ncbi:FecR family protein [Reyranella sp.]|uniref:FecR family protein n=1 Tax=Reyranella sp. TaxID=1929291 RepID=UPI003BA98E40